MLPSYEEREKMRKLRAVALDWHDGIDTAMYRFATARPVDMRQLGKEAEDLLKQIVVDPDIEKPRLSMLVDYARTQIGREKLAKRFASLAEEAGALGLDLDDAIELVRAGWPSGGHSFSPQMTRLISDARAAGLVVDMTTGGCRIYHRDPEAESDGLYGLGVDILITAEGGFDSATRIDVDLSIATTIRTIKAVRKLLLG